MITIELRYVYYLHFSDYCPHLCCHVYHNISAVVRSSLLQVFGMLALYFTHHEPCLMDISYLLLISLLKVLLCLHQVLNSHSFGYVTGSNQHLYPLCHVSLRTSMYEFMGIINLISSATIFTSAHILQFCSYHYGFFWGGLPELI